MGRLVTRRQLQSAANQIGAAVANALRLLEEKQDARLERIEKALKIDTDPHWIAKPELVSVTEDDLSAHGLVAQNTAPAEMPTNYIGRTPAAALRARVVNLTEQV